MSPLMDITTPPAKYSEGALIPVIDQHGDNPITIRLTDRERDTGLTDPATLQQLLYAYHRDGFVVLENAIPDALTDKLYDRIVADTGIYIGKAFQQWNQGEATKNVSVVPPLSKDWLMRDFYANVHMIRMIEYLLGPQPELRFLNSNVALPGSTGRQAVHSDVNHAFPPIPFGIVVNTYLQDSGPENGVTEIWCGSHDAYARDEQQVQKESGWIRKDFIQAQANVRAPVQPRVRKGSMLFRDLRLWHAGMPNRGEKARVMLAIDYFAAWYKCPMRLKLPLSAKSEVESWGISTIGIEWVDGEIDHLDQPFFLNMTQDPEMYIKQTPKGVEDWRARATGKYEFDKGVPSDQNWWTAE
ncbi:hypothetical protein LTR95_009115 [Oleoguttula sp. CCFEE 5521]